MASEPSSAARDQAASPAPRTGHWRQWLRCSLAAYLPDALVARLPYRPQQTARTDWDAEYAGGDWEYLHNLSESGRYGVLAAFCSRFSSGGGVLDHGCGEGIFSQYLVTGRFSEYLGVDVSSDAIRKANERYAAERIGFQVGDVETFAPDRSFDLIVFNEVLYYLAHPEQTLARYAPSLAPGGVFIVSMFDMLKSRKVWQALDARFDRVHGSRVLDESGHAWSIRVYRPRA